MKVIFFTDLHGAKHKYNASLDLVKSLKADVVINGGDMLPFGGNLFKQGKFITNFLDPYFSELNKSKIYHLGYLGNDDLIIFDELYEDICNKYDYIIPIAQYRFELKGFEFIGMNWIVDYPFILKDRARMDDDDYKFQEQLGEALLSTINGWKKLNDWQTYVKSLPTIKTEINDKLIHPNDMSKAIYIIHMPPANIKLDVCQHGPSVGSTAIYDFIKRKQPKLSFHGHIHECFDVTGVWKAKIGNSICIQPGQTPKREKTLVYVIGDLITMKFERCIEHIS